MSHLQRMIVIPPEIFEKFKHIVTEDQKLTELDKKMKTILYDKNLNDINKWHQYRENLMKYSFAKKDKCDLSHLIKSPVMENSSQTNKLHTRHKEIQSSIPMEDNFSQTDKSILRRKKEWTNEVPSINEVFETSNRYTSLTESDKIDAVVNSSSGDNSVTMDEDDEIKQVALDGQPLDVKILRERRSQNPKADYRMFELTNGEVVTIPVNVRITRSKVAAAEGIKPKGKNGQKSTQSTLPFKVVKKVKKSHNRKELPSNSSTPKKRTSGGLAWSPYK